jgi:hypothetical protein
VSPVTATPDMIAMGMLFIFSIIFNRINVFLLSVCWKTFNHNNVFLLCLPISGYHSIVLADARSISSYRFNRRPVYALLKRKPDSLLGGSINATKCKQYKVSIASITGLAIYDLNAKNISVSCLAGIIVADLAIDYTPLIADLNTLFPNQKVYFKARVILIPSSGLKR